MSDTWAVFLLSLLPGAGNFLGGMAAELRAPSGRVLNWALHAASGIIIAIVAIELIPEALASLAGWWIALAFALGGCAYMMLDRMVEHLQRGKGRMWMIYAAVAIDLTTDGLMIGTGMAVSPGFALTLAAGQVLADVPEGYATIANFRDKQVPRARRILLSASFFSYVVGSAMISYLALRDTSASFKSAALVFAAGLLTVAAVEDIHDEAHEAHADSRHSTAAFIGGFVLFTLVSAGLSSLVAT